ncbi:hypothetical protein ACLOJK_031839 [Asimina triloba]
MGKLGLGKVLDCLCLPACSSSCLCTNSLDTQDDMENRALIGSRDKTLKFGDVGDGNQTLAFHLKPKVVVLRVSMHCNGCARKVGKHISKIEGVTSFEVDLESKKVTVTGDVLPFEVLESVSKETEKTHEIASTVHDLLESCSKTIGLAMLLGSQYEVDKAISVTILMAFQYEVDKVISVTILMAFQYEVDKG